MTEVVNYDVFVDEIGTITSPETVEHYGYGFFAIDHRAADGVSALVAKRWHSGMHLQSWHKDRKEKNIRTAIGFLEDVPSALMGATVITDQGYLRKVFDENLARHKEIERGNAATECRPEVRLPRELLQEHWVSSRMHLVYIAALASIVPMLTPFDRPICRVKITFWFGVAGNKEIFLRRFQELKESVMPKVWESLHQRRRNGTIPSEVTIDIQCGAIEGNDGNNLFGYADIAQGIADHLYRQRFDSTHDLGVKLYDAARVLFARAPRLSGPIPTIKPGVYLIENMRTQRSSRGKLE